jgi:hypothetical protein
MFHQGFLDASILKWNLKDHQILAPIGYVVASEVKRSEAISGYVEIACLHDLLHLRLSL